MTKSCQVRGAEQVTDLELEQFLGTKETQCGGVVYVWFFFSWWGVVVFPFLSRKGFCGCCSYPKYVCVI